MTDLPRCIRFWLVFFAGFFYIILSFITFHLFVGHRGILLIIMARFVILLNLSRGVGVWWLIVLLSLIIFYLRSYYTFHVIPQLISEEGDELIGGFLMFLINLAKLRLIWC